MFIIDLDYIVPLEELDQHMAAHVKFLNKYYKKGIFVASGRKVPRTGGIILCKSADYDSVKSVIREDPFNINNVADYEITEFRVADHAKEFNWEI